MVRGSSDLVFEPVAAFHKMVRGSKNLDFEPVKRASRGMVGGSTNLASEPMRGRFMCT